MTLISSIETTLNALLKCGYEDLVNINEKNIHSYCVKLSEAAKKSENEGNINNFNALTLLRAACSPSLNPSNSKGPFKPYYIIWNGQKSPVPSDFSTNHGQLFAKLAPKVQCPEFASRLADLGWLICRDINSAKFAIDNYINASQSPYCQEHWHEGIKRLERALRLALTINSNKKQYIVEKLLAYIDMSNAVYDLRAADIICKLLLDTRTLPPDFIAEKALILTEQAIQKASICEFIISLLNIAVLGFSKSKQPEKAEKVKLEIAEALLQKAEQLKAAEQMFHAADFYKRAINQLQKCKGQKERILAVQPKLEEAIKGTFKEMKKISLKMDTARFNETISKLSNMVIHQDHTKTLICFALFANKPLKRKWLEETAIDLANKNPISSTFPISIYNGDGRLVAVREPLLGSTDEKYKNALVAASYNVAQFSYASAFPVMFSLIEEVNKIHDMDEKKLYEVLQNSDFLPRDRLNIWIKGFLAGFKGEFDVALSLLIPQFEHALRKVLEAKGGIVWRIEPVTGFHSEILLNQLLDLKDTAELLGEDLQFELQGLLTERLGFNYRNEFAHGLMPEQGFCSPIAIYIWWLLFHIVVYFKQDIVEQVASYQENVQKEELINECN